MKRTFLPIFIFLLHHFSSYSQDLQSISLQQSQYAQESYSPFEDLFYWLASEITYGILIETSFERDTPMHDAQLSPYPYFTSKDGNYNYEGEYVPVRLELQTSLLLDKNKQFTGSLSGKFRFLQRLDVSASYTKLRQHQLDNSYFLNQTELLLNYHRIRTRPFDFWYGLGVIFTDSPTNSSGFLWGLGAELFLKKPISIEANIKWSYFDTTTLRKTHFSLNYFIDHWRLQGGLEYYKFLDQRINTFRLGLRYYF